MISQERAVAAALQAIDEDGLERFSLGLVADRLKVRVPSLYYHFKNKSELLSQVMRSLFLAAEHEFPPLGTDWKFWMVASSLTVRRKLLMHPKAVPLLLSNPPRGIALSGYKRTLKYLKRCGIPSQKRLLIISGSDAIMWGSTIFEAASIARDNRSLALFDSSNIDEHVPTKIDHHVDDEKMYIAVVRHFLDGVVPEENGKNVTARKGNNGTAPVRRSGKSKRATMKAPT
jgi:AcrR family transcriptional regulator